MKVQRKGKQRYIQNERKKEEDRTKEVVETKREEKEKCLEDEIFPIIFLSRLFTSEHAWWWFVNIFLEFRQKSIYLQDVLIRSKKIPCLFFSFTKCNVFPIQNLIFFKIQNSFEKEVISLCWIFKIVVK